MCIRDRFCEAFTEGFKAMVPAIMILTLAWTLSGVCSEDYLNIGGYVSSIVNGDSMVSVLMPAIFFLIALGLAFATGTSWGTFGILIPIAVAVFGLSLIHILRQCLPVERKIGLLIARCVQMVIAELAAPPRAAAAAQQHDLARVLALDHRIAGQFHRSPSLLQKNKAHRNGTPSPRRKAHIRQKICIFAQHTNFHQKPGRAPDF